MKCSVSKVQDNASQWRCSTVAKNKLILKEITAVALCKQGCNPAADIKLYKSMKEEKEMNFTELLKSLSEDQQALINAEIEKAGKAEKDKMTASIDGALENPDDSATNEDPTVAKVAKALVDAKTELETVKKSIPAVDPNEEILKGLSEPVRKMLEDAQAATKAAEAIAKQFAEEKIAKKYEDAAAIYKSIPGETSDLAIVMKTLATADEKAYAKFETILAAVNKGIEEGSLFKEMGKGNVSKTVGTATAALNSAAEEVKKATPSLTKEQAYAKAIVANPELYKQYLQEMTDSEQE